MTLSPLIRLQLLSELSLPPAAAVPTALALIEEAIPSIGSMLLWSSDAGDVAGAYSSLVGMEDGLAYYVNQYANSSSEKRQAGRRFRDEMADQAGPHRYFDQVAVSREEIRASAPYLTLMQPYGIEDMARTGILHDGQPVAGLAVFRGLDGPAFSDAELDWLDQARPWLGRLLASQRHPDIPMTPAGPAGAARLSPDGEIRDCTAVFRQHLAMLNQNAPGQTAGRFSVTLPRALLARLNSQPQANTSVTLNGAWGDFQIDLHGWLEQEERVLISQRQVPVNLKLFGALQHRNLSRRQLQVACGLAEGAALQDLAERWKLSRHSVVTHSNHLYDKLGVDGKYSLFTRYVWNNPAPDTTL